MGGVLCVTANLGVDRQLQIQPRLRLLGSHVSFRHKRHMHHSEWRRYSITSSARASSVCGTLRPRTFAVLRLMISSTFVDCWTGRSAGFSPPSTRPV